MILCDREIVAALEHGQIEIEPRPAGDAFKSSSVDLRLDVHFRRWKTPTGGMESVVDPSRADFNFNSVANAHTEDVPLESDGSMVLKPDGLSSRRMIVCQ